MPQIYAFLCNSRIKDQLLKEVANEVNIHSNLRKQTEMTLKPKIITYAPSSLWLCQRQGIKKRVQVRIESIVVSKR